MKKIMFVLITVFLSYATTVSADGKYFGVDYMLLDVEQDDVSAKPNALSLKLGNSLSRNMKIEGIIGISMTDDELDSINESGFGFSIKGSSKVELGNLFGVYIIGSSPTAKGSDIYGKIGIVNIEWEDNINLSYSIPGLSETINGTNSGKETGLSYGFGFNIAISPVDSLSLEYTVYPDVDVTDAVITNSALARTVNISTTTYEIESTSLNIGYKHRF